MSSDAPSNKGLNRAAEATAALSKEAFEWFKQEYENTAPERAQAEATANEVARANLDTQRQQTAIAADYNDYNKSTYRPLEKKLVADAMAYDTPERRAQAATRAVADVDMQVNRQRQATMRDLASYGVSPDSAKSQSINASGDINASKIAAGAAAGARERVEATGLARMTDAASLGRGLPAANATAVQTGIAAGNGAVGASNASLNATNSGAALMGQGFDTAIKGNQAAGNLYGQASSAPGADLGGLGGLAQGAAALWTAFSDENMKSDIKDESGEQALKEIESTPVKKWRYDPAKGGPDDGGRQHTGPMAQMVNATMGEKAAPGGKVIDLVTMNGKLMAGMQQLSKKVSRIEQRMAA